MMGLGRRAYLFTTACIAAWNVVESRASTPQPSAISVPVQLKSWSGLDGFWSLIELSIGSTQQKASVLVSTRSQETLVVSTTACDTNDSECARLRGGEDGGLFNTGQSKSWKPINMSASTTEQIPEGFEPAFAFDIDPSLGYNGSGAYGSDDIGVAGSTVHSQLIGLIDFDSTDYWLGFFGLGVQFTNTTNTSQPSFLDSAVQNQSLIPSYSYGYTAGAHYQPGQPPVSLTLGGYDAYRLVPHNVSFELDTTQSPVVRLNDISVNAQPLTTSNVGTGWEDDTTSLFGLADADLFTIDSTTPYLWLPEPACTKLEKALGLTYDEDFQLFTFGTNDSQRDTLVDWDLSFNFTVADPEDPSKSVVLSLPYKAFDLQLSYPYTGMKSGDTPVNYFPVRKAANSTQYTIGRAFLQEVYLMVDYERNNFSLSQATFPTDAAYRSTIIDITRPKNRTMAGPYITQKSMMSKGEIAGVAVGAVVAAMLLVVIGILCFRIHRDRRNKRYIRDKSDDPYKSDDQSRKIKSSNSRFLRWLLRLPAPDAPTEIGGAAVWAYEAPDDRALTELPEKSFHSELEGSTAGTTDVPAYQEADRKRHVENAICAIGHDPEKPVELPYRSSARGFFEPEAAPKVQFAPPALIPARHSQQYRLSRHNTQTSAGISSPSDSPSGRSSKVSSPIFPVSPITPGGFSPQEYSSLTGMARREAWYVANDDRLGDQIPRRPTPAVSLLSESIHSRTNSVGSNAPQNVRKKGSRALKHEPSVSLLSECGESECSNATTVTGRIRRSVSKGFSWDHDRSLDQTVPDVPPPANRNSLPR